MALKKANYSAGAGGGPTVTPTTTPTDDPASHTPALTPAEGDVFVNTADNLSWVHDGSAWLSTAPDSGVYSHVTCEFDGGKGALVCPDDDQFNVNSQVWVEFTDPHGLLAGQDPNATAWVAQSPTAPLANGPDYPMFLVGADGLAVTWGDLAPLADTGLAYYGLCSSYIVNDSIPPRNPLNIPSGKEGNTMFLYSDFKDVAQYPDHQYFSAVDSRDALGPAPDLGIVYFRWNPPVISQMAALLGGPTNPFPSWSAKGFSFLGAPTNPLTVQSPTTFIAAFEQPPPNDPAWAGVVADQTAWEGGRQRWKFVDPSGNDMRGRDVVKNNSGYNYPYDAFFGLISQVIPGASTPITTATVDPATRTIAIDHESRAPIPNDGLEVRILKGLSTLLGDVLKPANLPQLKAAAAGASDFDDFKAAMAAL